MDSKFVGRVRRSGILRAITLLACILILTIGLSAGWLLVLGAEFRTTSNGSAPVQDRFRLGGFANLSGFDQDELSGEHAGLARLVLYRRIGRLRLLPIYLGFSLEAGGVWESRDDVELGSLIPAGSVFVGLDTLIGPVFLGGGVAEEGNYSAYFFIGRSF